MVKRSVAQLVFVAILVACGSVVWHYCRLASTRADLRTKGFFVVGGVQIGDFRAIEFPPNLPPAEVTVALHQIGSVSSPKRLFLNGNHVDGGVADKIARFKSLRSLDVSDTGLTDDLLRKFVHLDKLEILILNGTDISDESIPVILSMRHLQVIEIGHTRVSADGVEKLRAAIEVVRTD